VKITGREGDMASDSDEAVQFVKNAVVKLSRKHTLSLLPNIIFICKILDYI